ncbi:hypothetical protein BDQ12DRAFT_691667 [Crucibulum laeve]|uniref:Uncharacterized protein n=1 Tax=Crucibulum laeve TaxID=68775 RepID=A0A5C3LWE2_9AGAR|nr:hypothetical protein BDQ12DRAFT_691667 [Crucibulum laeve]
MTLGIFFVALSPPPLCTLHIGVAVNKILSNHLSLRATVIEDPLIVGSRVGGKFDHSVFPVVNSKAQT